MFSVWPNVFTCVYINDKHVATISITIRIYCHNIINVACKFVNVLLWFKGNKQTCFYDLGWMLFSNQ